LRVGFLGEGGEGKRKKKQGDFQSHDFLSLAFVSNPYQSNVFKACQEQGLFEPPNASSLTTKISKSIQFQTEKVWIIFEKIGNILSSTFCF